MKRRVNTTQARWKAEGRCMSCGGDRPCKPCAARSKAWHLAHPGVKAARVKARRQTHPETYRAEDRKRQYGLTAEAYERLGELAQWLCGICARALKRPGPGVSRADAACVDHNHATGAVRGLLCTRCNTHLSVVEDWLPQHEMMVRAWLRRGSDVVPA